jgi:peroxiredoxin
VKRNALIIVVLSIVVALLIYAGARYSRPGTSAEAAAASLKVSQSQGNLAPEFELASLSGQNVKLSSYRGKAVLLNFWATWCAPCKIEMPWFVDLYKQYQPQGLEIVGVAMDDSGKDEIERFAKEMKVNYTILQGTEKVGDAYGGIQFLPETFIVDRNGKIVKTLFGIHSESDFEDGIKQALATTPANAAQNAAEAATTHSEKTK